MGVTCMSVDVRVVLMLRELHTKSSRIFMNSRVEVEVGRGKGERLEVEKYWVLKQHKLFETLPSLPLGRPQQSCLKKTSAPTPGLRHRDLE